MSGTSFEFDFWALVQGLVFVTACLILSRFRALNPKPQLFFSNLGDLTQIFGRKSRLAALPRSLYILSLLFFLLAYLDPHLMVPRDQKPGDLGPERMIPREGIAIYLVLDHSGSMAQMVKARSSSGGFEKMTKLDLLKDVTRQFVEGDPSQGLRGRPSDMIGLVSFARGAEVLAPLTLDHNHVLDQLEKVNFIQDRKQDGTAIGYALFKTINLIAATRHYAEELVEKGKPAYEMKNAVIVLITDGFQDPNPLDKGKRLRNIELLDAGQFARDNDVKVYIVNVEPKIASEQYKPQRNVMKSIAEMSGGKFYLVDSTQGLQQIYQDIDQLEKSVLPEDLLAKIPKSLLPNLYQRYSFYPFLIAMGLGVLFLAVLSSTTIFRRLP